MIGTRLLAPIDRRAAKNDGLQWARVLHNCGLIAGLPTANENVLEEQVIDAGAEKCFERLAGRVNYRLTFDIEAGVQNHFPSGGSADSRQQRMEV